MDMLKSIWNLIIAVKPLLPLLLIPFVITFVRYCITDGFKYAVSLFAKLFIALVAFTVIIVLILLFV